MELSGYVIILVENVDGKIKLYGSPPDRDNLEVGDEILEINGLTLENISRAEIIRHIHDVGTTYLYYLHMYLYLYSKFNFNYLNLIKMAIYI